MMPEIPTLGKDRLLTREEALKRMKTAGFEKTVGGRALLGIVERDEARVWVRSTGELSFQYNPFPQKKGGLE
jgi:hypothetical protein